MKNQTLIEQIIAEGGNPSNTEVYNKNGNFICFADEMNERSSIFKLFTYDCSNWIAILK